MEIIKTRDLGHTGWLSGFMMCGKPARKVLRSACSLTGVSIHRLPMHCSGQDGSGEEQRCGIRETPVHRKAVSASRLNTSCGAVTDRCRSTARSLVCRVFSDMEIRRTGFHVTEKPLQLMKDVIQICEPGGLILDPFAGAGTTVLAAVMTGYRAVGIEVTDAYYKLGSDRVKFPLEAEAKRG